MTQWSRGFVIKYSTYLVIQRAFSETAEHNHFPDPPNGAARVIVLGAWCLLPRHDNDPDYSSQSRNESQLCLKLWLAVDKVIHHHDVLVLIIIRARRRIAGRDPDARDQRLIEHDAEKGKTRIARRSRDETAEQHLAVGAEVFNQRVKDLGSPISRSVK